MAKVNETNIETESQGLSLKEILFIIKKHILAIIICVVVGAGAGAAYSYIKAPSFSASASLLASPNTEKESYTNSDFTYMNSLSSTFVQLIKENQVLNKTVEKLNTEFGTEEEKFITKGQLSSGISASCDNLFISVTYTMTGIGNKHADGYSASNKERAVNIVNALVDVVREISETKIEKDGQSVYKYKLLGGNLEDFSPATVEDAKTSSGTVKNVALFAAVGLAIAVVYIIIRELFDNRFKSQAEIERLLDLPIIASVPYYTLSDFPEEKDAKENK